MNQYEWYEVIFQIPGIHKRPQTMVAQYLGVSGSIAIPEYSFSLRPLAGTQTLRQEYVQDTKPLGRKAAARLPRAVAA